MHIERTKIHKVDRYLSILPPKSMFKVISVANEGALARAGFEANAATGSTILPSATGRVSSFNASGRCVTRRDLPREERYIMTREFTRTEWHGRDREEVTDLVDIYRLCYPREMIPPPAVELSIVENEGERLVTSPTLQYVSENAEHNKHVINLMLELFGECEIALENLGRLTPPTIRRANWVLLPPGEHPWGRIEAHIKATFRGKAPTVEKAVLARQQAILTLGPSTIVTGKGGFSDYIAYILRDRDLVILESVYYGNALYVLGDNWEAISRMTKAEIIRDDLAEDRIVHTKGWFARLASVLLPKAAE